MTVYAEAINDIATEILIAQRNIHNDHQEFVVKIKERDKEMHAFFWITPVYVHFSRNTFLDFTKEIPLMVGIKSRIILQLYYTNSQRQVPMSHNYMDLKEKVKVGGCPSRG